MGRGILRGAVAGAAGTTALDAVTYLDMAVRGRGTSSTPEDTVERGARVVGLKIPGEGETRANRVQGLGPLSGIAVGVGTGVASGVVQATLRSRGQRLPAAVGVLAVSAVAMALANGPMTVLGVTDPRTWSATDWLSDAVPHLAYGLVTYAALQD
ncbi:hypothetical protein PZ938_08825 [Luteipulveratus sp. YIM 133132]|uniref:hypothetical protein n=1 Tax=Luteipulveratus flavus TaxID=3031728 RepID=UPI0023AF12F7|nr:hypothetical protein [Luteipulveratus sp. YIM 133132]MDE9365706.1 hypothetical protein [Luteipulveratus sp. YIM 133132]